MVSGRYGFLKTGLAGSFRVKSPTQAHGVMAVQRRAARFIKRDYSYESGVTQMLNAADVDVSEKLWKSNVSESQT